MSTYYYFACDQCRSCQETGKNGYLWIAPPEWVKERDDWLLEHEDHPIRYVSEHRLPDYWEEWSSKRRSEPATG